MLAHKILGQACQMLNDTLNARKYTEIQFGLMNSIINSGDGRSCKTAWKVIQISEEYFLFQILNAKIKSQNLLISDQKTCEEMVVEMNGVEQAFYFDVSKIFETRSH
ncbi:MAG: DUF4919 domain-containing protein, partial [Bacteroidales bacterium]|jgi:hypothetical protein|nr:DUF4919 domain-containing protein [Bacteroidales bacterium]